MCVCGALLLIFIFYILCKSAIKVDAEGQDNASYRSEEEEETDEEGQEEEEKQEPPNQQCRYRCHVQDWVFA